MNQFIYKAPYEENGKTVLEVNILPSTYCTFNCIYCPIDRREERHQTDEIQNFGDVSEALKDLLRRMDESGADEVFLNAHGESLLHDGLGRIIDAVHEKGASVRLLSNGYLLDDPRYRDLADRCESVIGELKNATEEGFQKTQRPLPGYTLDSYISHLKNFRRQYRGHFIFEVSIIKGYTDSEKALSFLESVVCDLHPDELSVVPIDAPFRKVLGVEEDKLRRFEARLRKACGMPEI
ncbi:MAG: radical SAM protein [Acidaminococcus sp.]|jgi:wyosine [tRNA(Phe)-imidazoG37] synthetase (radical SAM superfamily)|nr:radical SAM protein [Acidaminococcus sp.]MCI2114437.1 radical SAM protein [Acidaminococcus sp.]MCI2116174.1 radical SAM protein [Acidaminococcus sp.]